MNYTLDITHAGNVRPCSPSSQTWFAVVHCYVEEACDLEYFKIEVSLHMDFKGKCHSFTQFGGSFHPKHLTEPAAIYEKSQMCRNRTGPCGSCGV